jgi:hypothetical protein
MQMQIQGPRTFFTLDPGWKNAAPGSGICEKNESTTEQHFYFSKIILLKDAENF